MLHRGERGIGETTTRPAERRPASTLEGAPAKGVTWNGL